MLATSAVFDGGSATLADSELLPGRACAEQPTELCTSVECHFPPNRKWIRMEHVDTDDRNLARLKQRTEKRLQAHLRLPKEACCITDQLPTPDAVVISNICRYFSHLHLLDHQTGSGTINLHCSCRRSLSKVKSIAQKYVYVRIY